MPAGAAVGRRLVGSEAARLEARRHVDGHAAGVDVDGHDHVGERRHEQLAAVGYDDVDVVRAGDEHLAQHAERLAAGRDHVHAQQLVVVVGAGGCRGNVGKRDEHQLVRELGGLLAAIEPVELHEQRATRYRRGAAHRQEALADAQHRPGAEAVGIVGLGNDAEPAVVAVHAGHRPDEHVVGRDRMGVLGRRGGGQWLELDDLVLARRSQELRARPA